MKEVREKALEEVHETAMEEAFLSLYMSYTREEAKDKLGLSWSNICTLSFQRETTVQEVRNAVERLRDLGYVVSVDDDNGEIVLEVSIAHDVWERLGE